MSIKILVADDEINICEVVKLYLERDKFTVHTAYDGEAALEIAERFLPDLLILDVMLPKLSGWDICSSLTRKVPVIFLTAKTAEANKINSFSLGADDYITKPFSPREFVARVKTVLRRSGLLSDSALEFPELRIKLNAQSVTCCDRTIDLTPNEFDLLTFLARHPRNAFLRDQLLTNVWGYDFAGDDRTVDATVKRLRQKLYNTVYTYIHTVWGVGYKFEVAVK